MQVNSYIVSEHDIALNERELYVSYTADYSPGFLNHMHNSCEILFVEEGNAVYRIDNVEYQLGANDIFITGPMSPHQRTITTVPFIRYGLSFLPSFIRSIPKVNEYISIFQTPSKEEFVKLKNIDNQIFEEFIQLIHRLRKETTQDLAYSSDMMAANLQHLTVLLARLLKYESIAIVPSDAYETMVELKNYVELNYYELINLKELSKRFFLQPSTISTNFKKYFGLNINNYINTVRVSNAVRIIEQKHISIRELAFLVGYSNENTFIRQFNKVMGVTPLQYRKRHLDYLRSSATKGLFNP